MERELLTYAEVPNGRLLAIAQLLRMGHPVSAVAAAVKCADKGDTAGAFEALGIQFPTSRSCPETGETGDAT